MDFTGERFVPQCQGDIAAEHYHRYLFASQFVGGKRVLDIASGEGYGSSLLALKAAQVTGVDVSPEAIANARATYTASNVSFVQGSATAIPLPDRCVDVVVSFETLEHLEAQEEMLKEIRRVLCADGLLIMSTPNKPVFGLRGVDQFHVRELEQDEFVALLHREFSCVDLLGQGILFGSLLSGNGGGNSSLIRLSEDSSYTTSSFLKACTYFIALASNGKIPEVGMSFLDYPQEKSDKVRKLQYDLSFWREQYDILSAKFLESEEKIKQLELQSQELEKRRVAAEFVLSEVVNSNSWKLTAPLRSLSALFRTKK